MAHNYVASVLYGPKDLRLEQREIHLPDSGEIQIEIKATGLCGSDLHYHQHYRNGDIQIREPLSLGHESAGIVSNVGPQVGGFEIGDHVALEVGVPCWTCTQCMAGRYNLCKSMSFRSSGKSFPHFQGTLQQRINHPAALCYKLPEVVPLMLGALIEPLSVATHATRRAQIRQMSKPSILILGAGAIGLLSAAMCKVSGVETITIADVQSDRVLLARTHGFATHGLVVSSQRATTMEDGLKVARETAVQACQLHGPHFEGFDVVLECTGVEACTQAAIYAAQPGGKVVLVGMGNPNQTLPLSAAALREVDILGSFRYANTYPEAIKMLTDKRLGLPDLHVLVTHTFNGLASVESAFEMAGKTHDKDGNLVLKVMVVEEIAHP